ncbi:glycoside hydrolase family 15 protein [Ferruginivarius sediminum]|uniref:Glycoside hydrolase family 15 protein n=1 Tax=Ferruginivarius sediminum TaxID=2661937 RepID=A0A369T7S4_9PROT|nr:glycoside hydrolase family 15 protein [Ferruginivarius sediminum]RDD61328.1 glycoside hydrolase family 15 protein [Ferruginivarius sediminum]
MSDLDLAVIGNCAFAALLDRSARIVWSCLPRFDGDPVFCALLDNHHGAERGFWDVELQDFSHAEQRYRRNSAVVETVLYDRSGNAVEIIDFAPRFKQFDRTFRPPVFVRRIRPFAGAPRVRFRLRPACGYGSGTPEVTRGSNHIRFVMPAMTLRLTTDAPPTYILEETAHVLEQPVTMVLGPDESLTEPVAEIGRRFFEKTDAYWREWTRFLALPFEWQDAVIRAAITLKLCSFEETGAVIAALTTSIPEAPHSGRNWDYRFCWLRDSFFVVHALNRLGATRTMESYLSYITNIVVESGGGPLQPVFGIALETRLDEREEPGLAGYRGMGPVRVGNDAYTQVQNDGYGAVVLATAQSFFDRRLSRPGDEAFFQRLERLGQKAVELWNVPDAGMWELRTRQQVHTFSAVMCWAACDRLARIAERLGLDSRVAYWRHYAGEIREETLRRAWNSEMGSFVACFEGQEIDASLLLLPELGFLPADDPRFLGTLACAERYLRSGDHVFRYAAPDDFGEPETAFNVCTFWYIDALAAVGRTEEARELFERMLAARNHLGLLSEDLDPDSGELWGNFPQTYSMVGLINSALRLSRPWEEAF